MHSEASCLRAFGTRNASGRATAASLLLMQHTHRIPSCRRPRIPSTLTLLVLAVVTCSTLPRRARSSSRLRLATSLT
eukprot:3750757-Rhodomonas_salina.1